ncbi:MAG: TonB-dependent receptor [Candidatus Binatia bacterium]|nr:TonB-dependent receptor [Candidatus Binatia bacterium]
MFLKRIVMALAVTCATADLAPGQDRGAPGYLETIEAGAGAGGIDQEIDATEAQAEGTSPSDLDTPLSGRARNRVEEIVVRARKRDEFLEDTPISITAVSAETLIEAQITRFDEIQNLVPNLRIDTFRGDNLANISIRGVGATEAGNPGVGVYVDGVFLPRALASVLSAADIQQVEVLRGPQGTLFGKNTLGGAINITTVRPKDELEGSVWVRAGNFSTVETRSSLNLPIRIGALEDRVFTRLSVSSANSSGYATNAYTGENHSDRNALWFLGSVRVLATDDIEINVSGNYFQDHSKGKGPNCVVVPEAGASLQGLITAGFPTFLDECAESKPREFRSNLHSIFDSKDYGVWGNAAWTPEQTGFLDDLTLKLLGSWRQQKVRNREDIDGTITPLTTVTNIEYDGIEGEPNEGEQYLVEGQAAGAALDGDLNFVAGVFAEWETRDEALLVRSIPGVIDTAGGTTVGPVSQDDWDWALFGQASYDVARWLNLTAGLRYTTEKRGVSRDTIFPLGDGTTTDPVLTASEADSKVFTSWTPMGSVALIAPEGLIEDTPVDHAMGYFTYSRGFSSGGFNAVVGTGTAGGLVAFDPATVDNFEIGFKTIGFDQRLTFNLALFHMDYDGRQVTQSVTIEVPGQELPETARLIVNADSATLEGLEAEIVTRPIDGLMLMANFGVLDSENGNFPDVSALDSMTPINRQGETFIDTPKFTSYIALQYSFSVAALGPDWLDGWLTPRLDWYYQSAIHTTQPEDPSGQLSGYNLLNARLSYDFLDDRAQVALWGRNITDTDYFGGLGGTTGFFGYSTRYYAPGATWGGELSYRFN